LAQEKKDRGGRGDRGGRCSSKRSSSIPPPGALNTRDGGEKGEEKSRKEGGRGKNIFCSCERKKNLTVGKEKNFLPFRQKGKPSRQGGRKGARASKGGGV